MNESTVKDLISLKEDLLKKVASIDEILSLSPMQGGKLSEPTINDASGLKQPSYKEKIASVLLNANKFLNITQIIDTVHLEMPNISRDEIKTGINSAKTILLNDKSIVKVTFGKSNQNSFYGSPKWLDTNGNVQPRFMYDESLIKEKKKIEI